MKVATFWTLLSFGILVATIGCKGGEAAGSSASAVTFAKVQPVLTEKCAGCHGANGGKAGVDLTSYESVMKGGGDGVIVKPGDSANSELVQVMRGVSGHKMMPPSGPPASEEQIKVIEDWIQSGANAG